VRNAEPRPKRLAGIIKSIEISKITLLSKGSGDKYFSTTFHRWSSILFTVLRAS
jgi:hypothetical protein